VAYQNYAGAGCYYTNETVCAEKLRKCLRILRAVQEGDVVWLLQLKTGSKEVMVIVIITSDRGLCGGYNSNLIKLAKQVIADEIAQTWIQEEEVALRC